MKRVSIIGGGITGLTTAIALLKQGIHCDVYEKALSIISKVGAGIWLQPNAMKVFDYLGVGEKIRAEGNALKMAEITTAHLKPFRKAATQILSDKKGTSIVAIHRTRLQKILFEALPESTIHAGSGHITHKEISGKLWIETNKDGFETDLLIGADGIHSSVRELMNPLSEIRYSGQTCWRGIAKTTLPYEFQTKGMETWGKQLRFGFSPISQNEVYWFAVALAKQGEKDEPSARRKMLLEKFSAFHPLVHEIIEKTEQAKMIRNDISDLKRLDHWSKGHVFLIGDAAHATTPNMGQGACQGIEDAYYLSRFLMRSEDPGLAFSNFEKARRKKVDYVVNTSWMFGKMAHHSAGKRIMKTMLKLTPEKILQKRMNQLYHVEGL